MPEKGIFPRQPFGDDDYGERSAGCLSDQYRAIGFFLQVSDPDLVTDQQRALWIQQPGFRLQPVLPKETDIEKAPGIFGSV